MQTGEWSACRVVDEIADEFGTGWDTDSNIYILTHFIESNHTREEFENYVRKVAEEEEELAENVRSTY